MDYGACIASTMGIFSPVVAALWSEVEEERSSGSSMNAAAALRTRTKRRAGARNAREIRSRVLRRGLISGLG